MSCSPGYGLVKGICEICPPGKYSLGGASICLFVPAGYYSDKPASSTFLKCPSSLFSKAGSTKCTQKRQRKQKPHRFSNPKSFDAIDPTILDTSHEITGEKKDIDEVEYYTLAANRTNISTSPAYVDMSTSLQQCSQKNDNCNPFYFTTVCPVGNKGLDPIALQNHATEILFPSGRVSEAFDCIKMALDSIENDDFEVTDEVHQAIRENFVIMTNILDPGRYGPMGKRFYHSMGDTIEFPHSSNKLVKKADENIKFWDGVFSSTECQQIVELFENSEHYEGNLLSGGEIKIDHSQKKASEFHISDSAKNDARWGSIERRLIMAVVNHTVLYEAVNPIVRRQNNPFGDEGFRMKRYKNDGTEHHAYHSDSDQEGLCRPKRLIAILIYMNDVDKGGETVFLNQAIAVQPRCGRLLMFPTSFSFVHAGRRPISNNKYVIANFLTT